jgi:hypothetical protein
MQEPSGGIRGTCRRDRVPHPLHGATSRYGRPAEAGFDLAEEPQTSSPRQQKPRRRENDEMRIHVGFDVLHSAVRRQSRSFVMLPCLKEFGWSVRGGGGSLAIGLWCAWD